MPFLQLHLHAPEKVSADHVTLLMTSRKNRYALVHIDHIWSYAEFVDLENWTA